MGVLTLNHLFVGSFVESNGASRTVFISLLIPCCLTVDFSAPPLIPNMPFLWVWNAPTEACTGKFDEPLDMSLFSLIGSPKKGITGQGITIFYTDRLGYYPHIDKTDTSVHGGIPQLGSLQKHLDKARKDIFFYLPVDNMGLVVIDWEDWRPTWERNWSPKTIYRKKSIELVQQQNLRLNITEATKIAKKDFEMAGRRFMEETLKLGKSIRPNHFWGFYLFPDCYNHNYKKSHYTGACPDIEKKRNDDLHWLWKESTALFPSIYLNSNLQSSPLAALFSRNRVQEAIRVSKMINARNPLPVFVYTRLVFTDLTLQFLSQVDLVNTIGETIALGASGIVIWGTLSLARSMKACLNLQDYMKITLNPYLINVTLAAKMCSQVLCKEKGICIRKNWNSDDYLHLNPSNLAIQIGQNGKYIIHGKPTFEDLQHFSEKFHCSCYTDLNCEQKSDLEEVKFINVCAVEDVCIDISLNPESSNTTTPRVEQETSPSPNEKNEGLDIGESWESGESGESEDSSESFTSSATVSPQIPRNDISGGLLILYMYSQHLKYLA
ncbi:hyaluronidase PH-20 [Ictidomys tridecemlineatus]